MCFPNFSCLAPNVLKWKQTKKTPQNSQITVFRCYGNKTWVLSLELLNSYFIVDPGSEWWTRRTSKGNSFVLVVANTLFVIIIQTLPTMFIASLVLLICCPGFVFLLCWHWKCHPHCLPPDTALLFPKNRLCTGGRRLLEMVMAFGSHGAASRWSHTWKNLPLQKSFLSDASSVRLSSTFVATGPRV